MEQRRSNFNPRTTVMNRRNYLLEAISHQGRDGAQSGGSIARPDIWGWAQQGAQPTSHGMTGTQSGRTEESTSAGVERFMQALGGYGVGSVGGAVGYGVGGPPGAAAGMVPGLATVINAEAPLQDVWAHQLMQMLRRYNRGI